MHNHLKSVSKTIHHYHTSSLVGFNHLTFLTKALKPSSFEVTATGPVSVNTPFLVADPPCPLPLPPLTLELLPTAATVPVLFWACRPLAVPELELLLLPLFDVLVVRLLFGLLVLTVARLPAAALMTGAVFFVLALDAIFILVRDAGGEEIGAGFTRGTLVTEAAVIGSVTLVGYMWVVAIGTEWLHIKPGPTESELCPPTGGLLPT